MTRHSHYYHRRPTNNQRSLNEYESLPQTPSPYLASRHTPIIRKWVKPRYIHIPTA